MLFLQQLFSDLEICKLYFLSGMDLLVCSDSLS